VHKSKQVQMHRIVLLVAIKYKQLKSRGVITFG
jgi:hypothetical protein